MVQITVQKNSAAAAVAGTDTPILTPPAGMRVKITGWGVGQALGTPTVVEFHLRLGAVAGTSQPIDTVTVPATGNTIPKPLVYEFVADGVLTIYIRNVQVLPASTIGNYSVTLELRADPTQLAPA